MATLELGREVPLRRPIRMLRQLAASVLFGLTITYVAILFALAEPPTLVERPRPVERTTVSERPGVSERPTLAEQPTAEPPAAIRRRHVCPSVTTGNRERSSWVRPGPRHTPRIDPASGRMVSEPAASLAAAGNPCKKP
jgi:hypothetical protein